MAALSQARNTPRRGDGPVNNTFDAPVNGTSEIFQGSIVCLDATGHAVPGSTATTLRTAGRAAESVDNSAGADGDKRIRIDQGVFKFGNSAGADEITQAEVGTVCYVVDDQTVAKTDGTSTRSKAGVVVGVDSDGVWVEMRLSLFAAI